MFTRSEGSTAALAVEPTEENPEYKKDLLVTHDNWHIVRFEIDSDLMTFSCYINEVLFCSTTRENKAGLKKSSFLRFFQTYYGSNPSATIHIDNINLVP